MAGFKLQSWRGATSSAVHQPSPTITITISLHLAKPSLHQYPSIISNGLHQATCTPVSHPLQSVGRLTAASSSPVACSGWPHRPLQRARHSSSEHQHAEKSWLCSTQLLDHPEVFMAQRRLKTPNRSKAVAPTRASPATGNGDKFVKDRLIMNIPGQHEV